MNHWEEDPDFPLVDWRHEVADDNTRLGYRDWVHHQRVADQGWTEYEIALGLDN
jgi:hypothetical protein